MGKFGQRLVQEEDIASARVHAGQVSLELHPQGFIRPLRRRARPGVVHEDSPHHARRQGEEMGAALPVHRVLADQPDVRLVHEGRRLQRVVAAVSAQMAGSAAAQLAVDQRQQFVLRVRMPVRPRVEQSSHRSR